MGCKARQRGAGPQMSLDVVDLREFYGRPLGSAVRRLLTRRIRARWRNVQGAQLVGLGFAVPYIGMARVM